MNSSRPTIWGSSVLISALIGALFIIAGLALTRIEHSVHTIGHVARTDVGPEQATAIVVAYTPTESPLPLKEGMAVSMELQLGSATATNRIHGHIRHLTPEPSTARYQIEITVSDPAPRMAPGAQLDVQIHAGRQRIATLLLHHARQIRRAHQGKS